MADSPVGQAYLACLVFRRQHERHNPIGVFWVFGSCCEGFVGVIVDFEKDLSDAADFDCTKVVFVVWVITGREVVKDLDILNNQLERLGCERRDATRENAFPV